MTAPPRAVVLSGGASLGAIQVEMGRALLVGGIRAGRGGAGFAASGGLTTHGAAHERWRSSRVSFDSTRGGDRDAFVTKLTAGKRCAGREATLVGTAGDDELSGTSRRDVIVALAGDDEVAGRGCVSDAPRPKT